MSEILIFTTERCGYCHAARALLRRAGLPFEEVDMTMDERGREAMAERTGGRSFPQVIVDGRPIGGFQELSALLHARALQPSQPAAV